MERGKPVFHQQSIQGLVQILMQFMVKKIRHIEQYSIMATRREGGSQPISEDIPGCQDCGDGEGGVSGKDAVQLSIN